MSVLLEWEGFELSPDDCHLELGWDRALQALDLSVVDAPSARCAACPPAPTRTSAPSG